jgi:hypothetical protein
MASAGTTSSNNPGANSEQEKPKIIKFGFDKFFIKNKRMSAHCKFCHDKNVASVTIA